ncbi:hypothetical protein OG21DRAFT_1502490 [Imleria badia]|nr:hypothetical protein OG21DRAFT_1502490 [Imleria badia]
MTHKGTRKLLPSYRSLRTFAVAFVFWGAILQSKLKILRLNGIVPVSKTTTAYQKMR